MTKQPQTEYERQLEQLDKGYPASGGCGVLIGLVIIVTFLVGLLVIIVKAVRSRGHCFYRKERR